MKMTAKGAFYLAVILVTTCSGQVVAAAAQAAPPQAAATTQFRNVRVFDGSRSALSAPTDVLVVGNVITAIGRQVTEAGPATTVIDGRGRTLMPGLTDAHVHLGLVAAGANPVPESHVSYVMKVAENMRVALEEGFTTVRDAGNLDPAYALAYAGLANVYGLQGSYYLITAKEALDLSSIAYRL